MNDPKPSSDAIEIALEKVMASVSFRGRPQLRRLLTHLVQYSLAENGDPLKEYTLGVEVFDRGIRFDPQCDSIVRVEAFNLRKALRASYRSEGATDLVTIGVPKGGYRATFRLNEEPPATGSQRSGTSLQPGRVVALTRKRPRSRPHSTLRATRHRSLAGKGRPPRGACLHRARGTGARMCFAHRQDWRHAQGGGRRVAMRPDARRCGVLRHHSPDHGSAQGGVDRGGVSLVGLRPKERAGKFLGRGAVAATGRMGDAVVYLQKAARLQPYATCFEAWSAVGLFSTGRPDAGLRHLRGSPGVRAT